jgi:hypothetical protein
MKKLPIVEYIAFINENKSKFNMGLQSLRLNNRVTKHAVSCDKKSNVGSLFTSKKQIDQEKFEINSAKNNYSYAQVFDKAVKLVSENNIENQELTIKLKEEGVMSGIRANQIVLNSRETIIKFNYGDEQKFIILNEITKQDAEKAIKSYGSKEDVFKAIEYNKHLNDVLSKSEYLLFRLANSNKDNSKFLFLKNKDTYKNLKQVYEECGDARAKILLDKINSFL